MEEWRDIAWYEGLYQVSNLGRVKSLPREVECKPGHTKRLKGKILSQGTNTSGYRYLLLSLFGHRSPFMVHRLVAIAFLQNPDNKPEVNHKDLDKTNNKVSNLEWSTRKENSDHAIRNGHGPKDCRRKLTKDDIPTILERVGNGESYAKIAKDYGMERQAIGYIVRGRNWKQS
jgi:hypothetical protein